MIIGNIINGGRLNGNNDYGLDGWDGVGKYLKDYSTLATGGLTGNLAVTYLGSYELSYNVLSVNKNSAVVNFNVYNTSTFQSATRPPNWGYENWYKNSIGIFLNSLFPSGPMSKTTQRFIWTETLYW
jgi:hypothetical protein